MDPNDLKTNNDLNQPSFTPPPTNANNDQPTYTPPAPSASSVPSNTVEAEGSPVISSPETSPILPNNMPPQQPVVTMPPPVPSQPAFNNQPVTVGGGVVHGDVGSMSTQSAPAFPTSRKKRPVKALLLILLVILVLGGGSAAVYFGIIVPNKPINVLKTAVENSINSPQTSYNGTFGITPGTSGGIAGKVDFTGAADSVTKSSEFKAAITITGVDIPVEARYVDKNLYIKVGDLSTLTSLANGFAPSLGSVVTKVNAVVANKWIEIDSTLLSSGGASCALNVDWKFTPADIKLLENQYSKSPFVSIKSTSNDNVAGQSATKFVLSIDDDKLNTFSTNGNLSNLSLIKAFAKCNKPSSPSKAASGFTSGADHKQTPLIVWVSKQNKQVVKVSSNIAGSGSAKDYSGNFSTEISYGKVSITAPTGALPALQVLANIEATLKSSNSGLSQLFGGASSTGSSSTSPTTLTQ